MGINTLWDNRIFTKNGPDCYSFGALTDNLRIDFRARKALSSHRTSVELVVETEGIEMYRISLPIQVSSRKLIYGTLFYAGIIIATIITQNYWNVSDSESSLILELIRWLVAIRLFIKFGSLPNLPLQ